MSSVGGAIESLLADWLALAIFFRRVVKIPRAPILATRRNKIATARLSLRRPLYTERFCCDVSKLSIHRNLRRARRSIRFLNDASQASIHRNEILVLDVLIESCDVSQAAIHRSVIAVKSQYAIAPFASYDRYG